MVLYIEIQSAGGRKYVIRKRQSSGRQLCGSRHESGGAVEKFSAVSERRCEECIGRVHQAGYELYRSYECQHELLITDRKNDENVIGISGKQADRKTESACFLTVFANKK